jgi:hypothetical protein
MKLIRNGEDIAKARREANKDCDKCPICGQKDPKLILFNRRSFYKDRKYSIDGYVQNEGIRYSVDRYNCTTCDSTWESEPYQDPEDPYGGFNGYNTIKLMK